MPHTDWPAQPPSQHQHHQHNNNTTTLQQHWLGPAGCVVVVVVVVLCKKYESIMVIDLAKGSEVYLVLELLSIILIGQFYCLVFKSIKC